MIKEYVKEGFTWFLSLFSFGIFMDDSVDSLIIRLKMLDLEVQAEEMVMIYQQMLLTEYLKGVFMCISVLLLCLVHAKIIRNCFIWLKYNIQKAFKKLVKKFKKLKSWRLKN